MADRLISVPAARSHIDATVADPILKACMNNVLDSLPAVDAVEVVRCGECRFCDTVDCLMSGSPGRVSASDFCSYGERRYKTC
jgi:hypothetical protein